MPQLFLQINLDDPFTRTDVRQACVHALHSSPNLRPSAVPATDRRSQGVDNLIQIGQHVLDHHEFYTAVLEALTMIVGVLKSRSAPSQNQPPPTILVIINRTTHHLRAATPSDDDVLRSLILNHPEADVTVTVQNHSE